MDLPGSRRLGASALLGRLGELFIADRLHEATQLWSFPCPVEVAGDLTVMKDSDELEAFFRSRHDRARSAGMTALVPRIIAIEMPRKHRFRDPARAVAAAGEPQGVEGGIIRHFDERVCPCRVLAGEMVVAEEALRVEFQLDALEA